MIKAGGYGRHPCDFDNPLRRVQKLLLTRFLSFDYLLNEECDYFFDQLHHELKQVKGGKIENGKDRVFRTLS